MMHLTRTTKLPSSRGLQSKPTLSAVPAPTIRTYYCHETKDSLSALHLMCKLEHLDAIKEIVNYQPSLVTKQTPIHGDLPLMFAVVTQNTQVINYLVHISPETVATRSNKNGSFGDRITALHLAISANAGLEIIKTLAKACPKALRVRSGSGEIPFQLASSVYRQTDRNQVLAVLRDEA